MKHQLRNNRLLTILLSLGILLSLTPYYTFGVLLILLLFALRMPLYQAGYFRSFLTRLAAIFLLFSAWLMTLATYGWVAHITPHPAVYLVSFALLYTLAYRVMRPHQTSRPTSGRAGRAHSVLSALVSIVGVVIMGASFYLSNPTLSSSIQIMTNGYDNSAHLSMIQTTYEASGYVYGPYDEIKDQIAWKTLTAYPQGWHYVNAYLWDGTGLDFFTPSSAPLDVNFYVLTVFSWYIIALFLFHQLLWSIAAKVLVKKHSAPQVAAFVLSSLLLQLLVFWGSLQFGFVTFIGALAFTFLLVAIVVEAPLRLHNKSQIPSGVVALIISLLLVAAVAQGWLFAAPVVGVSLLIAYAPLAMDVLRKRFLSLKQSVAVIITVAIACIPILIQLMINRSFSTQGTNQINDDGGIFGISTMLAAIIITITVTLLPSKLTNDKELATKLSNIVLPPLLFTGLLFAYQLFTIGHTAYFFTKLLAFTLCLIWLPFTYIIFIAARSMSQHVGKFNAILVLAIWFMLTPLMFGQNIESFTKLLQRNSNVSVEAAEDIASTAENGSLRYTKTFVFTGESIAGDTIGTIFTTTLGETKSRCDGVGWLISKGENAKLPQFLNPCADKEDIQVITSNAMDAAILNKLDQRIHIIR